jgi:aspartate aminotransferase
MTADATKRRVASRLAGVALSGTVETGDRIRAMRASGVDVINLGSGDPDFATPASLP